MDKISLLLLEDMAADAELVLRTLEKSGMRFNAVVAHNEHDFVSALDGYRFDAILADNSLPQFSALEAMNILKTRNVDLPFILVTGSVSEEFAVKMMHEGVSDYILKDRLQRLPNSVLSAIDKYKLRKDRQRYYDEVVANEALMKEAARLAKFGSWEYDFVNDVGRWSDEKYLMLGYNPGQVEPIIENFLHCVHPDDLRFVRQIIDDTIKHERHTKFYCRVINNDGTIKHIYAEMAVQRGQAGNADRVNGFILDVSEIKEAEQKEKKITADLLQRNQELEQFAYIISHNLRSPVANIIGVSNALVEGDLREDEHSEFMDALSTSIKKLDNIILDLNYILEVKNKAHDNKEPVRFSEIVKDIKFSINSLVDEKGVVIADDFSEINEMHAVKSYIHSIFYNLISNSIKFRKANVTPVIEIKSSRQPGCILLTFKDNSVGIDLKKRNDQVFGLYKRFHPEKAEGKGMGLFMVKTQVEAIGGKISVDSKVNAGTEFRIEFYIADDKKIKQE